MESGEGRQLGLNNNSLGKVRSKHSAEAQCEVEPKNSWETTQAEFRL